MNHTSYKLGDFCQMRYGKMPPKDMLADEGFPIFSGYRITGYAKEYLYDESKVVVVARGVGGTGDVKLSPEKSWITNLSIVLNHDERVVNKQFLFYKLGREPLKEKLNTGAAQAQITIDSLSSYSLALPELPTQFRIASILSAYDDLIENNRRRIQLLEQAARLLYKEWFVRFRFPGHEYVKVKDGVPEGWTNATIADIGQVVTGKTPSKKRESYYGSDIPFIKTPNMHGNILVVETEESLSSEGANTQTNKTLPPRSILVSCIGTVGVVSLNSSIAQTNQQINAIVPMDESLRYWTFFMASDLKPTLEGMSGGATMANVNKAKFSSIKVIIPSPPILSEFNSFVAAHIDQIEQLALMNIRLTQARDLLLPRLMNGKMISRGE